LSTLENIIFCGFFGFFAEKAQNIPLFLKKSDFEPKNNKSGQTCYLSGFLMPQRNILY